MFEKLAAPLSLRYGSAAITLDHARSVLKAVSAHVHANEQAHKRARRYPDEWTVTSVAT